MTTDRQWHFGWKKQETALQYIDESVINMEKMAQPLLNSLSKQNPKVQWKIPRCSREMSSAIGVTVPEVTLVAERETSVEDQDQESPSNEDK